MNSPTVSYPCRWSFTLIGTVEDAMRNGVARCLGENAYRLTPSKKSRGGKYVSLHLDTEVNSEDERNRLFACLKKAPAIKMIL